MARVRRILFTFIAAISLLCCLAVAAFWVRSFWSTDGVAREFDGGFDIAERRTSALVSARGTLVFLDDIVIPDALIVALTAVLPALAEPLAQASGDSAGDEAVRALRVLADRKYDRGLPGVRVRFPHFADRRKLSRRTQSCAHSG